MYVQLFKWKHACCYQNETLQYCGRIGFLLCEMTFCLHSFTWKMYPMEKFERLSIFVHMMKLKTAIFWSIKPRRWCKPPLSALLLLAIHHALLHMLRGPPKLQSHKHNPSYDVVSASPGHRACDLGRGDFYPALLLTKTHMAQITWVWQQILGVDSPCL